MPNLKRGLESLLIASILYLNSCNVVARITEKNEDLKTRNLGFDPCHINSCGPKALHDLFKEYSIKKEPKDISKEILKNNSIGSIARNILAIIDNEAMMITWPWEIKEILEKNINSNMYVISVKSGNNQSLEYNLKNSSIYNKGIILVKDKSSIFSYHYISLNSGVNLINYYGKNTEICKIFYVESTKSDK